MNDLVITKVSEYLPTCLHTYMKLHSFMLETVKDEDLSLCTDNVFFLGGGRLQSDVQSIKIKTVLNTMKQSPAVLKVEKKIKKLPKKLPKKTLTRLQKLALKNVLGIRDNLNPDTWSKIEESIVFFMKIGKFLKYRNISTYNMKDPSGWRDEEFMVCNPNTLGAECHTPCGFGLSKEGYKFCYLKGGS